MLEYAFSRETLQGSLTGEFLIFFIILFIILLGFNLYNENLVFI